MKVFSGSSNTALAQEIVGYLGIDLGKSVLEQFSDGEVHFYIDENVRGEDVFVIQTGAHDRNFHHLATSCVQAVAPSHNDHRHWHV